MPSARPCTHHASSRLCGRMCAERPACNAASYGRHPSKTSVRAVRHRQAATENTRSATYACEPRSNTCASRHTLPSQYNPPQQSQNTHATAKHRRYESMGQPAAGKLPCSCPALTGSQRVCCQKSGNHTLAAAATATDHIGSSCLVIGPAVRIHARLSKQERASGRCAGLCLLPSKQIKCPNARAAAHSKDGLR